MDQRDVGGDQRDIGRLLGGGRANTLLAWLFVGIVVLVGIESLLTHDPLWAGFAAGVTVVAVIPPAAFRSQSVMVPWEVLGLTTVLIAVRAAVPSAALAVYLSVAALALMVSVELDAFTEIEMTYGFAVVFVILTTMATAGAWALARWGSDVLFDTGFLSTDTALMWEFVDSAVAGIAAGLVFEWYFRRRVAAEARPSMETGS